MTKVFKILQHKFHCGNSYLGLLWSPIRRVHERLLYFGQDLFFYFLNALLALHETQPKFATCSHVNQVLNGVQNFGVPKRGA